MNLIHTYKPVKSGESHKSLRLILKDNHVYTLNQDIKSLEQIKVTNIDEATLDIKVSPYYYTKEMKSHDHAYIVDSIDDIFKCIKDHSDTKNEIQIKLISNNIDFLCSKLIEQGSEQKVYFSGSLYKVTLKVGKIFLSIEKYSTENVEEEPLIEIS
jgi:hypothetical protein